MPTPRKTAMKRAAGFSLVELLVAMAVTLIIVAATLGLFQDALHTNETSTQMGNMNGNLRSAMNLVARDFLQAGQGIPTGGVPIPSGTGATPINRPAAIGTLTFPLSYTNLPAVIPGNAFGPGVIGVSTDMATMLYQDNNLITSINPATLLPSLLVSLSSSDMTFSSSTPITGANNAVQPGDLFLVYGNGLYRYVAVTSVSGQSVQFVSGDAFNLNQQGTAASGTVDDLQVGGIFPANCCSAQRVLMVSYFVDASVPNVPRLMRQINMSAPRPVAEVIEDLQISYDYVNGTAPVNNQTSSANAAAACGCAITDNQIRKVNLYMAGRSDQVLSKTNQYLRTNFATQLDLRSLAFVNRYQ